MDPLAAAWRIVGSSSARLVLTALLLVALLLGSLLPQVPTALGTDRAVIDRWVNGTAARYGPWAAALKALQLFDIAHALWFHLLLAAVGWHFLIQSAQAAASALSALGRRALPGIPHGRGQAAEASLAPPLRDALHATRSALAAGGLQLLRTSEDESAATEAQLYADRNRWGLLARVLRSISPLLILAGLLANTIWGWRTGELRLAAGQQTDLGPRAEVSVRMVVIPSAGRRGSVQFLPETGEPVTKPLGAALPACVAGVCVHQTGDGPALGVSAHGSGGRLLPLRAEDSDEVSELLLLFGQPQAERLFTVPDASLAIRVIAIAAQPSEAMGTVPLLLQAYKTGSSTPVLEVPIDSATTVSIGEVSLDLTPQRYLSMTACHLPGVPWLAAGALLLLLGVATPVIWPPLQVWVTLVSERRLVTVQLLAYSDSASIDPSTEAERLARAMGGDDVKIG